MSRAKERKVIDKVPIYYKQNLTIPEAVEYSNIGTNRLDTLTRDPNCNFVLRVGSKRLIKREMFDEFIRSIDCL